MALDSVACNNCGAPLQVPEEANFVTCVHCSTQLSVKRTGNARFTEAIEDLREQVEKLTRQNELAALDREWALEKESFMVSGEDGHRHLPTKAGSVFGGIVITVFGMFCFCAGAGGGWAKYPMLPVLGVLFVAVGIVVALYRYGTAEDYEQAHRRYNKRRREILEKRDTE